MRILKTLTGWRATVAAGLAAALLPVLTPAAADARTLDEAKASGKVVIGIQGDNAPWGFINSTGVQEGYDADLARGLRIIWG